MTHTEKLKWIEGFDFKKCQEELRYYRQTFNDMARNGKYDTSHCEETIKMLEDRVNEILKTDEETIQMLEDRVNKILKTEEK